MRKAATFAILLALFGAGVPACGRDLLGNEGFEIDCDGRPCDWKLVEGNAVFASSWHAGDPGADLSGTGRSVIEQRSAPFALPGRELVLRAGIARHSASLRVELDWYVAGAALGATYWDREPVLIDSRAFDIDREGVFALEELISTPSLEASGLILRVVKDGAGTAIIDEVFLSEPEVAL
jgi:hypothetical protein